MKRNVIFAIALWAAFLFVAIMAFGCKNEHHKLNNNFIQSVTIDDKNSVTLNVDIPNKKVGLLTINSISVVNHVVIHSGDIILGVLRAGEYTATMQLLNTERRDTEVFTVPVLLDPKDTDPPTTPPEEPYIVCTSNQDGGAIVTVELNGVSEAVVTRSDDPTYQIPVDTNVLVVEVPLDKGVYTFRLIVGDVVVSSCTVEIDENDNDTGDPGDAFEIPDEPRCPRTRFNVCHNGHNILLPWHALKSHSRHVGDKLGKCD